MLRGPGLAGTLGGCDPQRREWNFELCLKLTLRHSRAGSNRMSTATTALTEQEFAWVQDCARHLRLVQADAASAAPEARRELLRDEVAGRLKNLPSASRERLFESLIAQFPVAGHVPGLGPTVPAVAAAPAPAAAPPAPESPEDLLKRFVGTAKGLSAEERAEWTNQLAQAGLVKREAARASTRVPAEWLPMFGLEEGQQPDAERLVALAAMLAELVQRLDQASRKALTEFLPRGAALDRGADLTAVFAQYLKGELETVEPQVRALSALLGALFAGMLAGGRGYGKEFLRLCAPAAVEDTIKLEGGGSLFGKSFEARCWEKYKDLAKGFETPDLIDRQIRDCVGAVIKSKMSGNR